MRFLHTADWHVGRTIRGRSRREEFEAVLSEVVEIARAEDVECLIVAGDVWDQRTASPDSDRLVYEMLRRCRDHGIQVVLLAGNHDSPKKLEALGHISELIGVYTQPEVRRPDAGGVITVEGREHTARIAAVPFITEGQYVGAAALMGLQEEWYGSYADGCAHLLRAMCDRLPADTVNVLTAHLFVNGAQYATKDGSEQLLHIGQAYGVHPQGLPATPQYIALGHIHRPQRIAEAAAPTAYAGSLLQLDFGEVNDTKGVYIVDAVPGRPLNDLRFVELTAGRRLRELRGNLDVVLARASEVADAHVRVVLDVDRPEPGLAQRVRDQIPAAVDVRLDYPELVTESEERLAHLDPREQFVRYYRAQHSGADPTTELLALFTELYEDAQTAEPVEA
ncbi:MAG TPA: exonuclease SbcCD subunit D [Dehalococcoidia bacterium]|nr:exonuclease SbcCD subunit D [Dehalococcoidia bacterium]